MSQDVSASKRLLKPAAAPLFSTDSFSSDVTEAGSFPVESYADRLMDDLFGDVERLLDSGAKLPAEPATLNTPTPALKAPNFGGFVDLVSPLMRRSELDSLTTDEQEYDALLAQETTGLSLTHQPLLKTVRESVRSYDRLLLSVGGLSLLAVLAIWLLNQQAQRQVAPVAIAPQTATSNPTTASTDNQFVTYLQQALKAIDQQQPSGNSPSGINGVPALPTVQLPGSPNLQIAPTTGATPSSATRPATGLSRLYVPIYQVPQVQSGRPSVAPLPAATAPTAVRPPIPLSVPGIAKTLVGVLELGDRSAALIEINGVTQRYRIGESIATSGWTLVEVSNNQAVVRRNGEVRSVFIGQNF